MNYSRPLLLDSGRKLALACGSEIRILNVSDSRHVSTLTMHASKVVGMWRESTDGEDVVFSCDEAGVMFVWKPLPDGVECQPLGNFPIPPSGVVEHVAFVGTAGEVALVVEMNRGIGLREILLQRNRSALTMADKYTVLVSNVLPGRNTYSFCASQRFCAVLTKTHSGPACNILPIHSKGQKVLRKNRRILTGAREATCVAVHPSEEAVAVGDHFGGVEIYYGVFEDKPSVRRRLHWHHMPVGDLLFSPTGLELYSCGHEGVLVQWQLSQGSTTDRTFLPRLGLPMTHLALSSDSSTLVATHVDNSFSLVNVLEFSLLSVIHGQGIPLTSDKITHTVKPLVEQHNSSKQLTNGVCENNNSLSCISNGVDKEGPSLSRTRPPMLVYDSRTQAIVTKAKPGYFQFYHAHSQQQLFLVDVVQENFVPDASGFRDVTLMSLSSNGLTMVTVDAINGAAHSQLLKFWKFEKIKQRWRLDTSIVYPHADEVLGCQLQPRPSASKGAKAVPLCLTWSRDGQIKIWGTGIGSGTRQWSVASDASYREGAVPSAGAWSPCGTRLALSFGSTLTLWTPHPLAWQCQLAKPQLFTSDITDVVFSPSVGGRVVVVSGSCGVLGWCLQFRRMLYFAPLDAVTLSADRHTGLIAVATHQGEVIVFRGEQGLPLARLDVGNSGPLAMLFCPPTQHSLQHLATKLVYYTEDKEMKSVPIVLFGSQFNLEEVEKLLLGSSEDGVHEVRPRESKLSLIVPESSSGGASVADEPLFAFRHSDRTTHVKPDFFVKGFQNPNYTRPSLPTLVTNFVNVLERTAAGTTTIK